MHRPPDRWVGGGARGVGGVASDGGPELGLGSQRVALGVEEEAKVVVRGDARDVRGVIDDGEESPKRGFGLRSAPLVREEAAELVMHAE
jgi:hypothetical protein